VWTELATRLEGRVVALEPLEPRHEEGLREAAADPRIWRWLTNDGREPPGPPEGWFEATLAECSAGREVAWATVLRSTGRPVGSTRFLTLRPEHRGLEIGWTWLAPAAWGTGANVEAKLLQLEHAFERLGCMRVEFKTDARNERSRAALAALPARFEGVWRKHMLVPGTRARARLGVLLDRRRRVARGAGRAVEARLAARTYVRPA
jgi:RimJ/RimL family protein N-acetyltransferase